MTQGLTQLCLSFPSAGIIDVRYHTWKIKLLNLNYVLETELDTRDIVVKKMTVPSSLPKVNSLSLCNDIRDQMKQHVCKDRGEVNFLVPFDSRVHASRVV